MTSSLQVRNSYRNIIQIALPISIAILIPQLNILTNTIFLGYYHPANHFTTQDLLAASGVAGIYYLTMVMMDYGLVSGILMLMSRKAGENDKQAVGKLFSNAIWLCVAGSFLLILFSCFFAPWLFQKTIHEAQVATAAIAFIKIRIWGLPFIVLSQLSNSFFLALSRSKLIILGSGTQTTVNILFDYLLIFGIAFFPEMGIQGSALASLLSEMAYLLVAFSLAFFKEEFKEYGLRLRKKLDFDLIKQMFVKSSPLILQYLFSIGAWEVFFIYVEHLGKPESALSQIYRSVFGIVGIAAWSLASTANSMVSNVIGQNKFDEVIPLIKKIITISFCVAFTVGLPMFIFPKFFLSLLTSDAQLVKQGIVSLQIVVAATWMLSVSTILFNSVVGTGQTRLNMLFELVAIIFYLVYITIVIEWLRLPLPYAWLSEFIYWLTLFGLSFAFFYSGNWKKRIENEVIQ